METWPRCTGNHMSSWRGLAAALGERLFSAFDASQVGTHTWDHRHGRHHGTCCSVNVFSMLQISTHTDMMQWNSVH